jgi:hypothetical protein
LILTGRKKDQEGFLVFRAHRKVRRSKRFFLIFFPSCERPPRSTAGALILTARKKDQKGFIFRLTGRSEERKVLSDLSSFL